MSIGCSVGDHLGDRGAMFCEVCSVDLLAEGVEIRKDHEIAALNKKIAGLEAENARLRAVIVGAYRTAERMEKLLE